MDEVHPVPTSHVSLRVRLPIMLFQMAEICYQHSNSSQLFSLKVALAFKSLLNLASSLIEAYFWLRTGNLY